MALIKSAMGSITVLAAIFLFTGCVSQKAERLSDVSGPADGGLLKPDSGRTLSDVGVNRGRTHCNTDIFESSRPAGDIETGQMVIGSVTRECEADRYSLILPKGQSVSVSMFGDRFLGSIRLYGPGSRGLQIEGINTVPGVPTRIDLTADMAGEYFILASTSDRSGNARYDLDVECTGNCDLKATRYPIILVHGFSGFRKVLGIGYFYKVADTYTAKGYDIHEAVLDPYNSSYVRGGELAEYIDRVLAETYACKVDLIAHSQGGVDSRYAISVFGHGDKVAVLNTISTPHLGTPIADEALENPTVMKLFKVMFGAIGIIIETSQQQQNLEEALKSLSTKGMRDFNAKHPDDPRVRYKSWAGRSCPLSCTNPMYVFFWPIYEVIKKHQEKEGKDVTNDGIVAAESARWGEWQGYLDADHTREVGQIFGDAKFDAFDWLDFYGSVIRAMANEGY